jgi:hypothetical protein
MSRRIDIELTSARPDGSWTWRAAGAREPRGVVDGALVPGGAKTGQVFKAEAEVELDGLTIVSVAGTKGSTPRSGLLELIPSDKPFEAVTQQLARRERSDRGDRGDRPRRDRPDGDRPRGDRPRGDRPAGDRPRGDRPAGDRARGDRPAGDRPAGDRPRGDRPGGDRPRGDRPAGQGDRPARKPRPSFTPPPELPQRPKAKRLKPGRTHRNAVLADLPEAQRPVAERALQGGIPAVRQAINEQNTRLRAEGLDEVPAAGLLSMAEQLLPKLRVAEWLDRADAAKSVIDDLDLRDLRSVVAAGDDPVVARDESTRAIAAELKQALATKQEKELRLWLDDIDAAIGVGRVVRALKLSSQPPKAGIPFPAELAKRLADAATASLTADSASERWVALLEAAAFSPVRVQVAPTARPEQPSAELSSTVKRLGPLLPQVAALFGIEVAQGTAAPKPLRPTRPAAPAKKAAPAKAASPKAAPAEPAAAEPVAAEPVAAEPVAAEAATEPGAEAASVEHAPVVDEVPAADAAPADDAPVADAAPADEAPAAEAAPVVADEAPAADAVPVDDASTGDEAAADA